MVADRETKMRETLKIMGLSRVAYGFSYIVMQGLLALLSSFIVIFALYWPIRDETQYVSFVASNFGHMSILYVFLAVLLYGLSLLTLAQVLSTLF